MDYYRTNHQEPVEDKEKLRAEINRDIELFLKKGGKISVFEPNQESTQVESAILTSKRRRSLQLWNLGWTVEEIAAQIKASREKIKNWIDCENGCEV